MNFSTTKLLFISLHVLLLIVFPFPVIGTDPVRCLEKERFALLKIKADLKDNGGSLSGWGSTQGTEEDKKDCCRWDGVECDNKTNHVIDPKSKDFTLTLHYGGQFHLDGDIHAYIGGAVYKFDFYEFEMLVLDHLKKVAERHGVKQPMRIFTNVKDGGFRYIKDDIDLVKTCEEKIKVTREVHIYIEKVRRFCPYFPTDHTGEKDKDETEFEVAVEDESDGVNETVRKRAVEDESDEIVNETGVEGAIENESDGVVNETGLDIDIEENLNEGDNQIGDNTDEESDASYSSHYSDDPSEDDKLFNENVNSESEWFTKDFQPQVHSESMENVLGEKNLVDNEDDMGINMVMVDENDAQNSQNFPVFNPIEMYDPTFELGLLFGTKKELKFAIHSHAIATKRSINITKNDKTRLNAKCANKDCGWMLHAVKLHDECTFQIRVYESDHTCAPSARVKNLKSGWLAKKYTNKFRSDPNRKVSGFRVDVIEDIRCHVSTYQAYKAKKKAVEMIEGKATEQYLLLWDFAEEVRRSNPGSTVLIGTDDSTGETRFERFYLCLQALKVGFLAGCRRFIGVDGCHLKGPYDGVLLSAVGVDPNNNIFPIAFAIVNNESRDTWDWFLCLLKADLNIDKDYEWTFMSDKQKGLIQAFSEIFPNSDHRFCVRHLHGNFKNAGFRGEAFKNALWSCASATTVNDFGRRMQEMRAIDQGAADWFNDKEPHQWSKSHFSEKSKCDMLLNNCCESFNSSILEARDKPILSMCEWIIEYLMKRMQTNRDRAEELGTGLCPKIKKLVDKNFASVGDCMAIKADKFHYLIDCFDGNKYSVDLQNKTCACRQWKLSGIPCKHVVSAIHAQDLDYHDFTDNCYKLDTYKLVYAPTIMPINGRNEWKPTNIIPLLPPNFGRAAGRPKKVRRRERDEPDPQKNKRSRVKAKGPLNENRMRRQQTTLKCGRCGIKGHNRKTCTSNMEPPAPNITEEIVESQEPMSQLTQEQLMNQLECERPQKLQVMRKISVQEVVLGNSKTAMSDKNAPNTSTSGTSASKIGPMPQPVGLRPPSISEQFQRCQLLTQMVNIRAPAPFVGGSFIRSVETCITPSCTTAKEIITEGGKKYVTLSGLTSMAAEMKGKLKQKAKGKETEK